MRLSGIVTLLWLSIAGAVISPLSAAADYRDTIDRSFEVRSGGTLEIESNIGSINMATHDEPTVTIHIVREIDSNDEDLIDRVLDNLDISFEQSGADVSVRAKFHYEDGFFSMLFNSGWKSPRLTFEISVPRQYGAGLSTVDGNIRIRDLTGDVEAHTVDGDIDISLITGEVEAGTVDGDLTIGTVTGNVEASSVDGDIVLSGIRGSAKAGTTDGDMTVVMDRVTGDGPLSFTSVDGDIDITLPADTAADLNASGVDMDMYTDFEVTLNGSQRRNSFRGAINGGGREIRMNTVEGDIYLRKGK